MKGFIILLVVIGLFLLSQSIYAHPPFDIYISFDKATKMINAQIVHKVSNLKTHYIIKVYISINGKEIIQHQISRQDNNEEQKVAYLIPDVKNNDVISVEAYCNISGKLKKDIVVR
ncbi:MAG: hypothetical protein NC822_05680 [Candidatus Omnitrophica bacterium]|nr:hypothetical protein [Candidatus Omnitrophota bacterium]MCM8827573.1 hypothetical protein [Candidatus Omnitrophota bacterium]